MKIQHLSSIQLANTSLLQNVKEQSQIDYNKSATAVMSKETAQCLKNLAMTQISFAGRVSKVETKNVMIPLVENIIKKEDEEQILLGQIHRGNKDGYQSTVIDILTGESHTGKPCETINQAVKSAILETGKYSEDDVIDIMRHDRDYKKATPSNKLKKDKEEIVYFLDNGEYIEYRDALDYDYVVKYKDRD